MLSNLSSRTIAGLRVEPGTCEIIATLTKNAWVEHRELRALRDGPCSLEIRADLTGEIDPAVLRRHLRGRLIYSLRSVEYGGAFMGDVAERKHRLLAAVRKYDLIDLEFDRDLTPELLAAIPPSRRRISWCGRGRGHVALASMFGRIAATPARLYLLAPRAETMNHAMAPVRFLADARRTDVTAFATGDLGMCSRLLAPWLGAPVLFASLDGTGDSGMPPLAQLLEDFPFPELPPVHNLFGIVGPPGRWSRSIFMQNTAYRELGMAGLFLPMPTLEFEASWRSMCATFDHIGVPFGGATVVAPFKEDAVRLADTVSAEAASAGAANLLVRRDGSWRAYTTDPVGVVGTLEDAGVDLAGRRAAVIGCGGAGRGAAVGLLHAGAQPTIINRGPKRARYAAKLLGVEYLPLHQFAPEQYSLIVHATPIRTEPPFDVGRIADDAVIVDLAYGLQETVLAAEARRRQLAIVDGWGVLGAEIAEQFSLMTGRALPEAAQPAGAGLACHQVKQLMETTK
jgi:3-dehydroquinate dehydratase/shikimate dehydrogenase